MLSWQEMYMKKQLTAKEAIGRIKAGDRIFIGGGCSQPQMLVRELADPQNSITDAEIYQFLSMGMYHIPMRSYPANSGFPVSLSLHK